MNVEGVALETSTYSLDPTSGLVRRAKAGDLAAFEEIIRLHEKHVLRIAIRMLGNLADAQDAAQETLLRLHQQLKSFDDAREFRPWLSRMTVNVCLDLLRKRRTVVPIGAITPPAAKGNPEDLASLEERRRMMTAALAQLPEKQRAAIVLRDVEGLSTAEVADALGSSESTVRSQISTARVRLRELLRGNK